MDEDSDDMLSRRHLLQASALVLPLGEAGATSAVRRAYLGGYAPESKGLLSLEQKADGAWSAGPVQPNRHSPSWLQLSGDGQRLYAVNEHADFEGRASGSIGSYSMDSASGALTPLAQVASGGAGPVHLSLHQGHAIVSHYGSGELALLAVQPDGSLGAPVQRVPAPDGAKPHAHMARPDPSGRWVLATDLGQDRLSAWRWQDGRLAPGRSLALRAGSGPRHFAFHPRLPEQLYLLNEKSNTLLWLAFDAGSGKLRVQAELSALPAGHVGLSYASDLVVSPDGRHLYSLNRLHDAISIFALASDGRPQWQGEAWVRGSYPRSCTLDAQGRWLFVCNQRSQQVSLFERQAEDGGLRFAGQVAAPSPAHLVLVT
ncbi:lactonase family protein [Pelomonas sp. SE-A7]|uniref:lactonase family protein n=1 Tax=Pelomonas sp. SE-A7 TaxID=3054953 RepID=UPI00259CA7C3|nr:lactonase family protein [Pelomonas sp. SE-A7]MDM4767941.1 lactonase family protein [Pelomonas sp. SE-A7]